MVPAVAVTLTASSAFADAPSTWGNDPKVSPLHAILVYAVFPIALFVIITLLVYVPSMSKSQSYQPGQPWRHEPQWFGGPRGGVEALEATQQPGAHAAAPTEQAEQTRGGASGRW